MTRYADPHACPDCRGPLPLTAASCPACALPLHGATAAELFQVLRRADDLLARLRVAPVPVPQPFPAAGTCAHGPDRCPHHLGAGHPARAGRALPARRGRDLPGRRLVLAGRGRPHRRAASASPPSACGPARWWRPVAGSGSRARRSASSRSAWWPSTWSAPTTPVGGVRRRRRAHLARRRSGRGRRPRVLAGAPYRLVVAAGRRRTRRAGDVRRRAGRDRTRRGRRHGGCAGAGRSRVGGPAHRPRRPRRTPSARPPCSPGCTSPSTRSLARSRTRRCAEVWAGPGLGARGAPLSWCCSRWPVIASRPRWPLLGGVAATLLTIAVAAAGRRRGRHGSHRGRARRDPGLDGGRWLVRATTPGAAAADPRARLRRCRCSGPC